MRLHPTFNRNHVSIAPGVDKENCRKPYPTWPIQQNTPVSSESCQVSFLKQLQTNTCPLKGLQV